MLELPPKTITATLYNAREKSLMRLIIHNVKRIVHDASTNMLRDLWVWRKGLISNVLINYVDAQHAKLHIK